jgi:hypothetical protein
MCDFGMVAFVGVWPNSAWSLFVVDGDYENRSARKSEVRPRKANQTISRDKYKWHEEPKPLSCRDILLLCGSTISKGWKLNDNFGWSVRLIEWRPSARTVWGGSCLSEWDRAGASFIRFIKTSCLLHSPQNSEHWWLLYVSTRGSTCFAKKTIQAIKINPWSS